MSLRRPAKQTQSNPTCGEPVEPFILSEVEGPVVSLSNLFYPPLPETPRLIHYRPYYRPPRIGISIFVFSKKNFPYHYILCIAHLSQIDFLSPFWCEDRFAQTIVLNIDKLFFVAVLT